MEVWKPVVGYEGLYEVSSLGQVRTLNFRGTGKTRFIKQHLQGAYMRVNLWNTELFKQVPRYVHTLVADAFLGPRPEGQDVCHGDNTPANNCLGNLRYDTHLGNMADTHLENHPNSKLSDLDRIDIYQVYHRGLASKSQIARSFKVNEITIRKIVDSRGVISRVERTRAEYLRDWKEPTWLTSIKPTSHKNRLSPDQRRDIVAKYRTGTTSYTQLAQEYEVNQDTIAYWVKRDATQASNSSQL